MQAYGWLLDPKRCIECRACEVACKQWNGVPTGINVRYRRVHVNEYGKFPNVRLQALSLACNHCDNPLCLKVCPVKAIWRRDEDGAVIIDQEKCVGCRFCEQFCPYDAPQFNVQLKKMQKCTMCYDRIAMGLQPACAAACPTGALRWGDWEEIRQQGVDRIEGFKNPSTTRPRIRFLTGGWQQARSSWSRPAVVASAPLGARV
ncbi:MAG: 4Fe-4S dicluster domain-containing protein [Bryobacteraceae bacterium]